MSHDISGMSHEEFHESARKAVAAHHQRLREDGLMGEERFFTCNLTPGDRIAIKRVGPSGGCSTYIAIGMTNHGEGMMIALNPQEARRFAAALLDNIEDCDPAKPLLGIPDPPTREFQTDIKNNESEDEWPPDRPHLGFNSILRPREDGEDK